MGNKPARPELAQLVFLDLTTLDSTKAPVASLDALGKHIEVDRRSFDVGPPAWFAKLVEMPGVTFDRR